MENATETAATMPTKFCKHCGEKFPLEAVVCTKCGCPVEELKQAVQQPSIVVNNSNVNTNANTHMMAGVPMGRWKNQWASFFLCLFLGFFGAHKFYEGKIGMGILYLLTGGLFYIGAFVDLIVILTKPNPYFV